MDIFAFTESENMRPEPFRVRFIPRSEMHRDVVVRQAQAAREFLSQFDGESQVQVPEFQT